MGIFYIITFKIPQSSIPVTVGKMNANSVHLRLFVSW